METYGWRLGHETCGAQNAHLGQIHFLTPVTPHYERSLIAYETR